MDAAKPTLPAKPAKLTPRERTVAGLVSLGFDNETISRVMHVTHDTARCHVRNVYSKWYPPEGRHKRVWLALQIIGQEVHERDEAIARVIAGLQECPDI